MLIKHFKKNELGRDIAVGDIHGAFDRLEASLARIGFDTEKDRLFSVGDLVDRNDGSGDAIRWLNEPWFHAVAGNHDQYVIDWRVRPVDKWVSEGGKWFQNYSDDVKDVWAEAFGQLPIGMEIVTEGGLVCVVHADVPFDTWWTYKEYLQSGDRRLAWVVRNFTQISRHRYAIQDTRPIKDIRALIVGHCRVKEPLIIGNVHHIDTEGWKNGYFTLYDLNTLESLNAKE